MSDSLSVGIASDHRGVGLKAKLKKFLEVCGYKIVDMGTHTEESCDYPDLAFPLCEAVAQGELDRGILICMSGNGMMICANKVKGVRGGLCVNLEHARLSRAHNDANVLVVGSLLVNDEEACQIAKEWLQTAFEGGRHQLRIDKINSYDAHGGVISQ